MMSCPVPAAWSRPVLLLCCTEYGPSHDAVLSGHITAVAISRSGQLGRRCTVETHCSGMHVCRRFSNARACLENMRAYLRA
jgi:predicted NBD/HSP70 family sugar kinase